jgi:CRISPR-associated endonuclease/helicase Cas3
VVNDLALAAWLHDIGKADRRFQYLLRGGRPATYYRDGPRILAESGIPSGSKAERQKAQSLGGYPFGTRHELQSLAMIEAVKDQVASMAHDLDLVMHLVGSHHGHCRPFAPAVKDPVPIDVSRKNHESERFGGICFGPVTSDHRLHQLDSHIGDRFWSLVAKYGWLELRWWETILRLADHRASESEMGE